MVCVCVCTYSIVSGNLHFNLRVFVGYPAQEGEQLGKYIPYLYKVKNYQQIHENKING